MKQSDLYYSKDGTLIFYSSVHAFRGNEIKVNTEWWEANNQAINEIKQGKLKYEKLKLVVTQEEIDSMLEKTFKEKTVKSIIEKALDSSLEEMKIDIDRVTNSFKRVIPAVQDAIEELSNSVSSSNSFRQAVTKASSKIEEIKSSLPSSSEIKDTLKEAELELKDAKKEFTQVTDKLKELFK